MDGGRKSNFYTVVDGTGNVETLGPVPVVVEVVKLGPAQSVVLALQLGVPRNADGSLIIRNMSLHVAVIIHNVNGPHNVIDAVHVVALHDNVAEGDNLIGRVICARERLLVDNVRNSVLLSTLGDNTLGRGGATLQTGLGEGVGVILLVVDERTVEGVSRVDVKGRRIGVVGWAPLEVLSVCAPTSTTEGTSRPRVNGLDKVQVVCGVHAKPRRKER
mmetsp:Transcript_22222/g.46157  ORF Transcript_22222/g.46157 Transcript_22222/m.46157 type:complete len:217 (+) Transcript_22222:524-1174(+)